MKFESKLVTELYQLAATKKLRTAPYHPLMNDQCERFNYTLMNMLGTLPEQENSDWKDQIASLVYAYNCTRSTTAGLSPYFLISGRYPRLALDVAFVIKFADMESVNMGKYIDQLRSPLK